MNFNTINALSLALQSKSISSIEVTQYYLKRIAEFNPTLNCLISVTAEEALQAAQKADQQLAKGLGTKLTGVPIIHKDNFCTEGILTTCASKMLTNFVSPYDATVVEKLKAAGMVLLGKANMDEFAMGASNETSFYDPVKNPWDLERVPGGSSGGSAGAVAAMLSPCATGSDTGGSIRQPAALNNLVGLKPTYGRVSRHGIIAFASSLDQAGPITHTAEDAAYMMNYMAGVDSRDSTSSEKPVPDYLATLNNSLKGLRIGIPKEFFEGDLNKEVAECLEEAIHLYRDLGADIKEVSLKSTHQGITLYYLISSAECTSNLARYDGVRYGYRCDGPKDLDDLYHRSRSEGLGPEVKRRILVGTHILSSTAYGFYVKAQTARASLIQEFSEVFNSVDVLLGPTTPSPAFKLKEKMDDPIHMYLSDIYTVTVSLAGLPAISLPVGFVKGLPVGQQLIGPAFSEARLLNIAYRYQQATDWHTYTPGGFEDVKI